MSIKLTGWNDFYDGWLAGVFQLSRDESKSMSWQEGHQMALETPQPERVLMAEISLQHITVETENIPQSSEYSPPQRKRKVSFKRGG